jgi:hypothetical protein
MLPIYRLISRPARKRLGLLISLILLRPIIAARNLADSQRKASMEMPLGRLNCVHCSIKFRS